MNIGLPSNSLNPIVSVDIIILFFPIFSIEVSTGTREGRVGHSSFKKVKHASKRSENQALKTYIKCKIHHKKRIRYHQSNKKTVATFFS